MCFIDYFSNEKIEFKKKINHLSYIYDLIIDQNNKSAESLKYFINFKEERFKKVKNMYIYNLVETVKKLLNDKYIVLKKKYFYFYDLSEEEKIRKTFFIPIKEEDLIEKIRKHPDIRQRKNKYEKEKSSKFWSFKENQNYPDIYQPDDSSSVKSTKTSESVKTVVEDLNIDKSMIDVPDPSLLNNLEN